MLGPHLTHCGLAPFYGLDEHASEIKCSRLRYDPTPNKHEKVNSVCLHGIGYYLRKEKDRHDSAMSNGAEKIERASRSPSPTGRSESIAEEPFWIVPDTSSLMKQARQSLQRKQKCLYDFEELYRYQSNAVKIFVPCAVQEEITNHGKSNNPDLRRPAKIISDFNSKYVRACNGPFVVFEDDRDDFRGQSDSLVRTNQPRTMTEKNYRDHRIVKSAERKKDGLQAPPPPALSRGCQPRTP